MEPAGCAAMARPVGAPPRLTEPPRPWKKAIGIPALLPHPGELDLGLVQLPVGGEEAAVLVGVGIADHHLLHPALRPHAAAHHRHIEQLLHDGGRALEILDGLEQRHDREGAALDAGAVGEEPAGLGQQVGAEDVAHAPGHAEDEGPERLAVHLLPQHPDQPEHAEGLRGIVRDAWGRRPGGQGAGQLAGHPRAPGLALHLRRLAFTAPGAPERLESRGELGGVLPGVEADGAEAERLHLAANRAHQQPHHFDPPRLVELGLDLPQIGEQGVGRGVAVRAHLGVAPLGSLDHHLQPTQHAGEVLAEHFPGLRAAISSPMRLAPSSRSSASRNRSEIGNAFSVRLSARTRSDSRRA